MRRHEIMKKYLAVIKYEWGRQMTHRINQFTYRIGNIFEILVQILIWTAIFQKASVIKGYTYEEMITYIIIGSLISFLMANFGYETYISEQIHRGELSNFLSKPIVYVNYLIALSIGRVTFTLVIAFLANVLIILLFQRQKEQNL